MGGRAGGGASGGMGSRSRGGGVAYFKETEKAVQLSMTVTAHYSGTNPRTGFWEDKDKTIEQKVWIPKSQMKGGKVSEWIAKTKGKEIMSYHDPNGRFGKSRPSNLNTGTFMITDAKGNVVNTYKS